MERDTILDEEAIQTISELEIKSVFVQREDVGGDYAIIYNTLNKDTSNSELEAVQFIYRQLRGADAPDNETARGIIDKLFFSDKRYDLGEVGRYKINRKLNLNLPLDQKTLTKGDMIEIIKYLVRLTNAKAEIDDIDQVMVIEHEAFTIPWSRDAFYNELIQNQFAVYLVLEDEGMVIGYCGVWIVIDEAHITNIALLPEYRGRKLGEALLRKIIEVAIERGAKTMTLEVRMSNMIAQSLYRKLGFQGGAIRKRYYTDNLRKVNNKFKYLISKLTYLNTCRGGFASRSRQVATMSRRVWRNSRTTRRKSAGWW
jgi:ribosomal-protein-alanine acetyltransferase